VSAGPGKLLLIASVALPALSGCAKPIAHDRAQELAACRRISTSGDALGQCLVIKYDWDPAHAGPAKAAWQRHLDSLRAGTVASQPTESEEQAAAHARRWAACVFRETGGDWQKESLAKFNCRSDLPDVDALLAYAKTIGPDSSRVLLEVYSEIER
jgi:hypothetical protein